MKVYKLTNQNMQTANNTQWGEGVTHTATGPLEMCENGFHAYPDPLMAVFMNPVHANIKNPKLFDSIGSGDKINGGTKLCFEKFTTVKEIPVPQLSTEQRVEIAIRLVLATQTNLSESYKAWAENWLNGTDRTNESAAEYAARAAEYAADITKFTKQFIKILHEVWHDSCTTISR